MPEGPESLDCVIIGGGVSGLYTGWRLLTNEATSQWSVALFEMSDRTGGRLLTWLPHGPKGGLRAELGGMRFFQQQELVWNLIGYLHLGITRFFATGPHRLYLRGHHLDQEPTDIPYDLDPDEQGKSPAQLIEHAINVILQTPQNRSLIDSSPPVDREGWDDIKPSLTYKGDALWDLGFWNVLSDVLSYEAYQYVTDGFGYYSLTANWNAAEAMQTIFLDFTQNPDYQTLVEGYSKLPDELRNHFERLGGEVTLNCPLLRFEANEDGSLALHFDGRSEPVHAKRLVLALPRRALELLQATNAFDIRHDSKLKRLLTSVEPYPAFKLLALYESRWWETLGIERGRSICDLPLRQTYYFRPDQCEEEGTQDCPADGLLLVSYDDLQTVDYWAEMIPPMVPQPRKVLGDHLRALLPASVFSGQPSDSEVDPPPQFHEAPEAMLRYARQQLSLLHGLDLEQVPEPLVGAYADWTLDPFGGGWNFWKPYVDVRDIMQNVKKPLHGCNVYIVGEAYSGLQGWVEGALTTAELVLQNEFDLDPPSWLPTNYYLGW